MDRPPTFRMVVMMVEKTPNMEEDLRDFPPTMGIYAMVVVQKTTQMEHVELGGSGVCFSIFQEKFGWDGTCRSTSPPNCIYSPHLSLHSN